ncbi:LOB domain-containing protein 24-like [Oryza brachyantha]|uniref:LOB domain-containing protein 24-like n=1 Tax=Oryza brachyantha TaxID=4533 RepID=UPI0003EA8B8D|nr:LOB domain-containing protein 24-like [Oryza brachyantha]
MPENDDDDDRPPPPPPHPAARRCAACRYLRRRCADDCVLAPFFPASRPHRYFCVHTVFGASNVARLLQSLPMAERGNAANTMAMEAYWRVQDPVYGCTGIINRLQDEIRAVQCELARTQALLAIALAAAASHLPLDLSVIDL